MLILVLVLVRLSLHKVPSAGSGGANAEKVQGPIAHFAYLVQMEMVRRGNGHAPVSGGDELPQFFFAVKSVDSWGRHHIEGYTHFTLPPRPGTYDLRLRTWKPKGTIQEKMADFFIGGALQLQDAAYASIPFSHRGPFLNKYGFQTESSGTVRVRVNWVRQTDYDPATEVPDGPMSHLARAKGQPKMGSGPDALSSLFNSLKRGGEVIKGDTLGGTRPGTGDGDDLLSRMKKSLDSKTPLSRTAPAQLGGQDTPAQSAAEKAEERRRRLDRLKARHTASVKARAKGKDKDRTKGR